MNDIDDTQVQRNREVLTEIADFFGGREALMDVLQLKRKNARQLFYQWSHNGLPSTHAWAIQGLSESRFSASKISNEAAQQLTIRNHYQQISQLTGACKSA